MTAPLSWDLRERSVRAVLEGSSIRQAAERFEVSPSAAITLMQRLRRPGSMAPDKIGGRRRPLLEAHADELREIVVGKTGSRRREIKATLAARGIKVKALSTTLTCSTGSAYRIKKVLNSRRTGPPRCCPAPPPLAGGAALQG